LVLDDAPNYRCRDLLLPGNISLLFLPPYSPELNPKENLWDEIREKIFKNYVLKSIDAYPLPHSPTSASHSDVEAVLEVLPNLQALGAVFSHARRELTLAIRKDDSAD
jgi:hypothetical protein